MSFTARYHGSCAFCGEELLGKQCSFADRFGSMDKTVVHTVTCLVPYKTGVQATAMMKEKAI